MALPMISRAIAASRSDVADDLMLKRIFLEDDLNRKYCLAEIDHAYWRAGLSESALLVHAHTGQYLTASTDDAARPSRPITS